MKQLAFDDVEIQIGLVAAAAAHRAKRSARPEPRPRTAAELKVAREHLAYMRAVLGVSPQGGSHRG